MLKATKIKLLESSSGYMCQVVLPLFTTNNEHNCPNNQTCLNQLFKSIIQKPRYEDNPFAISYSTVATKLFSQTKQSH